MRGGTYLVLRRIRTTIERWDELTVSSRRTSSVATSSQAHHSDSRPSCDPRPRREDSLRWPLIPIDAHVRLAAPQNNGGSRILRRVYNYNNGVDQFTERWPPWRQGLEYDIGVLFGAYQRDPRTGFIRIFGNLAFNDAFNQFTTHTASIVAIPPGAPRPGTWIAQLLFDPEARTRTRKRSQTRPAPMKPANRSQETKHMTAAPHARASPGRHLFPR